ncbi:MAG: GIY-YIG nuclease family protein [Patescibacteria group bacterium]
MRERQYYIYILTNKTNEVLYIGVTNNLLQRIYQHKNKLINGFTARYNLNKLVYYEIYQYIQDAIQREKQIKKWNREWKIGQIQKFNPRWEDLYIEMLK